MPPLSGAVYRLLWFNYFSRAKRKSQALFFFILPAILLSSLALCGSLISRPKTLAVDALPVWGSIAKVVMRLRELYVVELRCRIYEVNVHHRTNLIGHVPFHSVQDQNDLFREFKVVH